MKYFMAILACLLLVGCSETRTEFVDHGNFSLSKPSGWIETQNDGLYRWQPVANGTESVSFFESRVPSNMTTDLQKLVELGLTSLHTKIPDLTVVQEATPTTLGNLPAIEIQFTATTVDKKWVYTQIFAKPENTMYTMTYSCKQDSCKHSDEFHAMAKSMIIRS
jgi:hypothetical protein